MEVGKIYVNEVYATKSYCKTIPKGLRGGYISVEYTDKIWSGLVKNVVFANGIQTRGILNAGTQVKIPPEVIDVPGVELRIGVCGVDSSENVVIPTLWAPLGTVQDGTPSDFEEADKELTPSVTEQILSLIGPMDKLWTDAKDSLVAAINEILKMSGGDVSPEAIAEAVAEYLDANPIRETNPTVPDWVKPIPAEVGQYFRVSAVDENGNVSALEAVDAPSGGGGESCSGLKLAAAVTTTENAATISVTGLSIKLPVTITVANPGESCGDGAALTVNGITKKSYTGTMKGTSASRPCCIGWLYPTDASMEGRWRASNNGWNVLSWTDIPEVIESIEISSAYNDGETRYFQSGTVVEIYEGVLPNVVA